MSENQDRKPIRGDSNCEAFCDGIHLPDNQPARPAPGQAFIDRFGLQEGSVYFTQGLTMDEAAVKHLEKLEKEHDELKAKIKAASLS